MKPKKVSKLSITELTTIKEKLEAPIAVTKVTKSKLNPQTWKYNTNLTGSKYYRHICQMLYSISEER